MGELMNQIFAGKDKYLIFSIKGTNSAFLISKRGNMIKVGICG
jgi:hypothetical protein